MGNENERKHDPSENRESRQGHQWDEVKTGGDERTVGLTGDRGLGGGGVHGSSPGTGGVIGGSSAFLNGEDSPSSDSQQSGYGSQGGPAGSSDPGEQIGSETKQVLTGDQSGGNTFGGQTGSGTSTIAANNSSADLGAGGPPGSAGRNEQGSNRDSDDEPRIGPGGQSEIGGASDLGGGETGQGDGGGFIGSGGDDGSDYLRNDGNPQAGFAEQGRGAPEGSEPDGLEGTGERTANRESDIEGSSSTR